MADSNKKIITGTGKVSFWSGLFKNGLLKNKKVWLIFGAIVVLVVGGVVYNNYHSGSNELIDPSDTTEGRTLTPYEEADRLAHVNSYEEGQKYLDDRLSESRENSAQQASIFRDKALLALNSQHLQDALMFAKNAEAFEHSRISAITVALTAEQAGDTKLALKYYKLVVERTDDYIRNVSPDDYQYYLDKINELGG